MAFWAIGRRRGMTSVEYALLLALIVVMGIGAWGSFSGTLRNVLVNITNSFAAVPGK
jgi:Flp pilus assembly pilin Flp